MKRCMWMVSAAAVAGLVSISTVSAATTYNVMLYPNSVGDGTAGVGVTGDAPTGFATGSIAANGVSYSKYFINPSAIFGSTVHLNDIASLSYWTKKPTSHTSSAPDWYLQMYTSVTGGSNAHGWYDAAINAEPYFSKNLSEVVGGWNQWSSNGSINQLRFFDNQGNSYFGSYTDGSLSDIEVTNLGTDAVNALDVGLATSWAPGFSGQVDGLEVTLKTGDAIRVNFEAAPVPLPSAAWGGMALVGMMSAMGGIKRLRKQTA